METRDRHWFAAIDNGIHEIMHKRNVSLARRAAFDTIANKENSCPKNDKEKNSVIKNNPWLH